MKLYTEEQVREMIEKSRETGLTAEYLTLTTKGIELPSNDEISEFAKKIDTVGLLSWEVDLAMEQFNSGAKWVIEQIKQQDNGE